MTEQTLGEIAVQASELCRKIKAAQADLSALTMPLSDAIRLRNEVDILNEQIAKFGFTDSLMNESTHWAALVRRKQVTLGSLILVENSEATALPELPQEALLERGRSPSTTRADFRSESKDHFLRRLDEFALLAFHGNTLHQHTNFLAARKEIDPSEDGILTDFSRSPACA